MINLKNLKLRGNDKKTENLLIKYVSAIKILETEIEVLKDEFEYNNKSNPFEHIKTRVKSMDSILGKLKKKNLKPTFENIINNINDIAGVRIVCSFIDDVYSIVKILEKSKRIEIIEHKDYIKNPKQSGYSSYHLIVLVPVHLSNKTIELKAEIQIRTLAMDFWASLEHKIKYKYQKELPQNIKNELITSSKTINSIDKLMSNFIKEIKKI